MSIINLSNIKLGYSALGHEIYLYQCLDKHPTVALHKRKAEFDVMQVITQHMMDDSPKGSIKTYTLDGEHYFKLTLEPCVAPTPEIKQEEKNEQKSN